VLILTMHSEEARLHQAVEAGASGFLTKDAADRELVEAIRALARGEVYVRPRAARLLAARARDHRRPADPEGREALYLLSDRERSVVQLIAEGYNGPEVGRQLGISAKTVDTYRQRIEEKLGLAHRTEYVRFALSLDLLRK
jgi:two-component system response regulator NreC